MTSADRITQRTNFNGIEYLEEIQRTASVDNRKSGQRQLPMSTSTEKRNSPGRPRHVAKRDSKMAALDDTPRAT